MRKKPEPRRKRVKKKKTPGTVGIEVIREIDEDMEKINSEKNTFLLKIVFCFIMFFFFLFFFSCFRFFEFERRLQNFVPFHHG